ncbi:MAG: M20 family metallopeptidase [Synergistaceae bacterium]
MNNYEINTNLGPHLLSEAESFNNDIIEWRRDFHQFPEPAFQEYITSSKIAKILSSFEGVTVITGYKIPTCVVAVIGEDLPGEALLLRTSIDAISVNEETGLPFCSCMPGYMHACGHDAHIASLLAAAKLISKNRDKLKHRVVLLFQPAAESGNGARILIENDFLKEFNIGHAVYAHWWPELPYSELAIKKNVCTAISDRIHIDITGVQGQAAEPHMTVDPVLISAHVMVAIQTMLTRDVDPRDPVVVSFAKVEAGDTYNIIPHHANLWGTLRSYNTKTRDFVQSRIEEIAPAIAKAFRGIATVEYTRNYDQVENDTEFTNAIIEIANPFFGKDGISILEKPLLTGEDFSFFTSNIPSTFMLLGTGLEYKLRNQSYDVPESMLPFSAAWEAYMALTL